MGERIVILEPGFLSANDGHHYGYNGMLGLAARDMGHEPVIVAHEWSKLEEVAYEGANIPVRGLLRQYLYQPPQPRSLDDLLVLNQSGYEAFAALPEGLFAAPCRLLVHTTNETQVLGLARFVTEGLGRRFASAVVGLMMPPPVRFATDGTAREGDPAACEIYRRAVRMMGERPGIRVLGIGATVAEDHARLAGIPVASGGALIGGIGRAILPRPAPHAPPEVLLFAGDAKLDKGFHLLPEVIARLRAGVLDARFTVQVSGRMAEDRYAWFVREVRAAAAGDARFRILEGRLDEGGYNALWDGADLVVVTYHPGVYARKTSGVCWDALNLAIPAVALRDSFHVIEMSRYGHPVTQAASFWPEEIVAAIGAALEGLPAARRQASVARETFVATNRPARYIEALFDRPDLAGASSFARTKPG